MLIAAPEKERDKGAIPVSIGTSLAIESIGGFGEFDTIKPPILKYSELTINVRTLIRNIISSIKPVNYINLLNQTIYDFILEEVMVIKATLNDITHKEFPISLYYCSYKSLANEFPLAQWKELKSDRTKMLQTLEEDTLKLLSKNKEEFKLTTGVEVYEYDVVTKRRHELGHTLNTVIITHYAVDLLWTAPYSTISLLESHTGKIKSKGLWNSKLTNGSKLERIPFNRLTIQVFGDKGNMFNQMPIDIRKSVIEMAETDKWTTLTTDERVRESIKKRYDPRERVFFLKLLGARIV